MYTTLKSQGCEKITFSYLGTMSIEKVLMVPRVCSIVFKKIKIFMFVVFNVFIDVMNNLFFFKIPANNTFSHNPMFGYSISFGVLAVRVSMYSNKLINILSFAQPFWMVLSRNRLMEAFSTAKLSIISHHNIFFNFEIDTASTTLGSDTSNFEFTKASPRTESSTVSIRFISFPTLFTNFINHMAI
jgi:hypothetical protein